MASYSFPKTSLTFNFEGGTSAIPIIVQDPSSYDNLVELLQEVRVRMTKQIPIMEVYKGTSPDGTLVGKYLLDDNITKGTLISRAGSSYYISDSGETETVYEDVNDILFPSTEFEYNCFFTVTTPKTRGDDSPNLMFTAPENTKKGINRESGDIFLSTTESYSDTPSVTIRIYQGSYIAEGYFLLIREGVEYLTDDPTYKGTATSLYLKQGKRIIYDPIQSNNILKVKLDRTGFELIRINGNSVTTQILPEYAKSYDKFLATITYEVNSYNESYFKLNSISYEDATDLESLIVKNSGIIVFRNKTNRAYVLCSDLVDDSSFNVEEAVYGTVTESQSFTLCLYLDNELKCSKSFYASINKLQIYDIYGSYNGNACYPVFLDAHGESSLTSPYLNSASIPTANDTSVPSIIKLGTTKNQTSSTTLKSTGVHDFIEQTDLFEGLGAICINVTETTSTSNDEDGATYNKEVQTLFSATNTCSVDNDIIYFGATYVHDKECFSTLSSEFSGACSESYPVSYAYSSEDFNTLDTNSGSPEDSDGNENETTSGCGCLYYGTNLVDNIYYGDKLIQAVYYGDTKIL